MWVSDVIPKNIYCKGSFERMQHVGPTLSNIAVSSILGSFEHYAGMCGMMMDDVVSSIISFKPFTNNWDKQCEHILIRSCWNSVGTSLLHVCHKLCVATCM